MWKMPSTAWMCERKALPRPAPSLAPLTRPAMSVTVSTAGTTLFGRKDATRWSKRSSGTGTLLKFGSMVQKG